MNLSLQRLFLCAWLLFSPLLFATEVAIKCNNAEKDLQLEIIIDIHDKLIYDHSKLREDPSLGHFSVLEYKKQLKDLHPTIKRVFLRPYEIRKPDQEDVWTTAHLDLTDSRVIDSKFYEVKTIDASSNIDKADDDIGSIGLRIKHHWPKTETNNGRGGISLYMRDFLSLIWRERDFDEDKTFLGLIPGGVGFPASTTIYRYPYGPGRSYKIESQLLCNVGKKISDITVESTYIELSGS